MNRRPSETLGGQEEAVPRQGRDSGLTLSVSAAGAAQALGISVRAVYYLSNAGELPMVKIGRVTRFIVKDLEAFLEAKRVRANSPATPLTVERGQESPLSFVPIGPSLRQTGMRRVGVSVAWNCDATSVASLPATPGRSGPGTSAEPNTPEVR